MVLHTVGNQTAARETYMSNIGPRCLVFFWRIYTLLELILDQERSVKLNLCGFSLKLN